MVALGVVRLAGALFLAGFGVLATRRVLHPRVLDPASGQRARQGATVVTTLVPIWLEPHVHLDAVVLLDWIASTHRGGRWWFAGGAALGSATWFTALGSGARLLRPVLARPAAWRVLDAVIARVGWALAACLRLGR